MYFTVAGQGDKYSNCDDDEFQCDEGDSFRCISDSWVCDGRRDCDSGADERNCGNLIFYCVRVEIARNLFNSRFNNHKSYSSNLDLRIFVLQKMQMVCECIVC
jgi:Low-density lipoprotein receptor domain class A